MARRVSDRADRVPAFEVMDLRGLGTERGRRAAPPGPVDHLENIQPSAPDAEVRRDAVTRELLVHRAHRVAVRRIAPADGACSPWADAARLGDRPNACRPWLEELVAAVTLGVDVDPERGRRFAQFSVAGRTDQNQTATARLTEWITAR